MLVIIIPEVCGEAKPPKGAFPNPVDAAAGALAGPAEEGLGFAKLRPLPKGEAAGPLADSPDEEDWVEPAAHSYEVWRSAHRLVSC